MKIKDILLPFGMILFTAVVAVTTPVADNAEDTEKTVEYSIESAEIETISAEVFYPHIEIHSSPLVIITPEETDEFVNSVVSDEVYAVNVIEETSKVYYDIPLSEELQDKVSYWKGYMNIDLDDSYIYALVHHESRFNPRAVGSSGDSGYCQILQRYFSEIYSNLKNDYPELANSVKYDIFDEETNLLCGIYWLDYSAKQVTGKSVTTNNLSAALTAYNRGCGGAQSYFNKNNSYSTSYSCEVIEIAHYIQEHNTVPQE